MDSPDWTKPCFEQWPASPTKAFSMLPMSPIAANAGTPFAVADMGSPLPLGNHRRVAFASPMSPDMGDAFCFRVLPTDVIDLAWKQDRKFSEPIQTCTAEPELRIEQQLRTEKGLQWDRQRESIQRERAAHKRACQRGTSAPASGRPRHSQRSQA